MGIYLDYSDIVYFLIVMLLRNVNYNLVYVVYNNHHFKVAKAYIIYREKHREARFIKERIDYMNQ